MRATVANIFNLLDERRPRAEEKLEQPRRNADLRAFLLDTLANGPVPTTTVVERGVARGFTVRQILSVRAQMKNIIALKETGRRFGCWMWALVPPTQAVYRPPSERATQ
jgi:hypothetical protein